MSEELLTVSQVAGLLGVGERTIREWHKAGVLRPDVVTSKKWRLYRRETIEKLARERNGVNLSEVQSQASRSPEGLPQCLTGGT